MIITFLFLLVNNFHSLYSSLFTTKSHHYYFQMWVFKNKYISFLLLLIDVLFPNPSCFSLFYLLNSSNLCASVAHIILFMNSQYTCFLHVLLVVEFCFFFLTYQNDVSDIPDLTFSMDADEEKHILYEKNEVSEHFILVYYVLLGYMKVNITVV